MKRFVKILVVGLAIGAISQSWGAYKALADDCDPVKHELFTGLIQKIKVLLKNDYFKEYLLVEAEKGDQNAQEILKTMNEIEQITTTIEIVEPGP